ncbi:MAG: tryptophan synthase subunit alpha [Bacteroidales bacterium]|jgi:tryptophan synthase alpha chain|nr:tryptophan synthase subunit alpha [Bacteroidales bacterium]
MNRIDKFFKNKRKDILSIYFTAGYPHLDSTAGIIRKLASAGVDMIEIGIPFSDPLADGPVIQYSNSVALKNGMNLKLLFRQLRGIRKYIDIPLVLMSYCNPILSYGMEKFCRSCNSAGIDGVIIPDLPPELYVKEFKSFFTVHNLINIMMISPQTALNRIREIDKLSTGFIYMVSSSSITGVKKGSLKEQTEYFSKIKKMKLKNPALIGFGISDPESFKHACNFADGAIVGSAFVKVLGQEGENAGTIRKFIRYLRNKINVSNYEKN